MSGPRDGDGEKSAAQPLLLCLVPVRNAESDLPGFLNSAARCCDGVLALDDGSTDATYDILAASPLVRQILRNPRREDYRQWDDAENRNRLLEAAAAFNPEWIISLDADERLDAVDAGSLRSFLETDALPGFAYGFRHVPMRNDLEHFWPKYQWVYRLFSYEPGQRFPNQKLHFVPVPTSIPRRHWLKTTLRIQHLGSLTPDRRLARFEKYLEADPDRTYQASYGHLLHSPADEDVRRWQSRPPTMSVLLADRQSGLESDGDGDPAAPALSAIIIAQNDEATIARSVTSVVSQDCPEPFEVIVVTSGSDRTAEIVRQHFPTVTHLALDSPALPGEARNAGLKVARGTFVSFPGSHVELLPGSLAARLRAHRRGYAMVTGVTENGNTTQAGWASYFLDHAEGLPGHTSAELNGPPAHCSYARLPLLEVGGFPEGVRTGEDTAVNRALVRRGYVALRDPSIHLVHRSPCTTMGHLVRHHFKRGRGWGRLLVAEYRETGGLLNRDVVRRRLVEHLPKRLGRIEQNVGVARADLAPRYEDARALIVCGAVAAWAGQWWEVLRPTPGKLDILAGRPVLNVLVGSAGMPPAAFLVQVDHVSGRVTSRQVPSDLRLKPGIGLATSLAEAVGTKESSMSIRELQQAASGALDVERLDCLVAHDQILRALAPGLIEVADRSLSQRVWSPLEAWLTALQSMRSGQLQTTLGPWQLRRLVSTVRSAGAARPE
jgi:glycosyltransferase involved in cell wall biosynthesis